MIENQEQKYSEKQYLSNDIEFQDKQIGIESIIEGNLKNENYNQNNIEQISNQNNLLTSSDTFNLIESKFQQQIQSKKDQKIFSDQIKQNQQFNENIQQLIQEDQIMNDGNEGDVGGLSGKESDFPSADSGSAFIQVQTVRSINQQQLNSPASAPTLNVMQSNFLLSSNQDGGISGNSSKGEDLIFKNDKVDARDIDDAGSASGSSIFARNYDAHMIDTNGIGVNDAASNEGIRSNKFKENWISMKKNEENSFIQNNSKNSDLDRQISLLKNCECIKESEVRELCNMARDILLDESNIQNISSPITICGDIHGQFYDLMELFRVGGDCPKTNYIFMGDFVDRGFHSVETFILLLALKVRYPDRIYLIRGNHESRQITQVYGFYDECLRKYGSVNVWRYCTEIFDFLPLAAIIDDKIFCVHGGLSPSFDTMDEIKTIDRKQEVPHDGAMCDLMWSDPEEINGWSMSPRGAGFLFGGDIVAQFCQTNSIIQIARAHQLVMDGYRKMFNDTLVTVWSAPNYCYRCGNVAAILELDENLNPNYKRFEAATNETRGVPAKKPAPEYFL